MKGETAEPALHLLAYDRVQLETIAHVLQAHQRMMAFLVCSEALQPIALDYLRHHTTISIPDVITLKSSTETIDALTEASAQSPNDVRIFRIPTDLPNVVESLNWHREKLRRGASVLLLLAHLEQLRSLRRFAPDAYSYRTALYVIQGETPLPVLLDKREESVQVKLARQRFEQAVEPIEKAELAVELARHLLVTNALTEASTLLANTLDWFSRAADDSERSRIATAELYHLLARLEGNGTKAHRLVKRGIKIVKDLDSIEARYVQLSLRSLTPSPFGLDYRAATNVFREIENDDEFAYVYWQFALPAATVNARWGNLREARRWIAKILADPSAKEYRGLALSSQGELEIQTGNLLRAEKTLREAANVLLTAGQDTSACVTSLADCLYLRGELDAAETLIRDVLGRSDHSLAQTHKARDLRAKIALIRGDVEGAFAYTRETLAKSMQSTNDYWTLVAATSYVDVLSRVCSANRASEENIREALHDLEIGEHLACSIAKDDPSWYSILFPALRAELLALNHDGLEQAIDLMIPILEKANHDLEDAVPSFAAELARYLLDADRISDARQTLKQWIPQVAALGHLRELAMLQAYTLVTLVSSPAVTDADIDHSRASMYATFASMDAPRIKADTLHQLAQLLPASSSKMDALDYAEEARALYADMDMPMHEGQCFETMGTIVESRGGVIQAKRYRQMALQRYRSCSCGLYAERVERALNSNGLS